MNKSSLDTFIKTLKNEKNESRKTYITYETGLENLQKHLTDSLMCKEKLMRERWRYHTYFDNQQHVDFVMKHAKERVRRKIFMNQLEPSNSYQIKHLIPTDESPRKQLKEIRENAKKYFKEIRIVPERLCDNNSFRIWDDQVLIVSFDENNEFIIITIHDKFIAEMMKNVFDFIWEHCEIYEK